jgi:hypothetical protein
VHVIVRTCCYSAYEYVLMCVSLILCTLACDYVTQLLLCKRVCGCATITISNSTDKCTIVIKVWYQIYASEHN